VSVKLSKFEGRARLFPLPQAVFFPETVLPLHIFEPRYLQMTADALAGDRLITMVLLKPGWQKDYYLRPAIHAVGCVGRIVTERQLARGHYDILLHGLARVRILEEVEDDKLYRSARVQEMDECELMSSAEESNRLRERLSGIARGWFKDARRPEDLFHHVVQERMSLGVFCDVLSSLLLLPAEFKQELLAEPNVPRRSRLLMGFLETHQPPEPVDDSSDSSPFSAN
jgi:Lon protease-like protein